MLRNKNWLSYDFYNWIDGWSLPENRQIHSRCSFNLLAESIREYPEMVLAGIRYYADGAYEEEGKPPLTNVPAFYRVDIVERISPDHIGEIHVYLPVRWNGDFLGIAGVGTNLEFDWSLLQTTNATTWPIAIRNGYACVVSNGGTGTVLDVEWGFLKDGSPDWPMIDHWAFYGTHTMTLAGKAVTEAAYGRKIHKSYMHGSSGGGRQVIVEAQRYPEDYDGLWADGPGIDYYNLMFSLLWAPVVFSNEKHRVSIAKFKKVYEMTRDGRCISMGPFDLKSSAWVQFVKGLAGTETADGPISAEDIAVMLKIWCGPTLLDGTRITYGFGPEIAQWQIGNRRFGCLLEDDQGDISVMIVALQCMRWFAHDPDLDICTLTYEDFDRLYHEHREEFERYTFYETDLSSFVERGGKLMITHGKGDPIVPVQIIFDFYRTVLRDYTSEQDMNQNFRVFFPEHAGHVLYDWTGPNVTNASGMKALVSWVEEEQPPEWLDTMSYDFDKDQKTEEGRTPLFSLWQWKKYYGK